MNAKHTPGPWIVEPMPGLSGLVRVVGRANNAAQTPLEVAGNLSAGNANLIGAAPEMYEALEQDAALIAAEWMGLGPDANSDSFWLVQDALGRIRAATAKARGEVIS
jgi:hypothetical protein